MMLKQLLEGIAPVQRDMAVTGLVLDSRLVRPGYAFMALAGSRQHGLLHVEEAIARGAGAIVYDPAGSKAPTKYELTTVPFIPVHHLGRKLGEIAGRFYHEPSRHMTVIGVTGTNGKTSCSQFLGQMLDDCGIIGTLGWGRWGQLQETLNTTPDALAVQDMLAEFAKTGQQAVAMEVSSHGLEQGRVGGVYFKGAVFTNISRDHLDYHGTMENYLKAKLALLKTPGLAFAVVNLDDDYSDEILAAIPTGVTRWGTSLKGREVAGGETVAAVEIRPEIDGTRFDVIWRTIRQSVHVPLYGDFNVENALTVLATSLATGMPFERAVNKLALLQPVPGRMECFGGNEAPTIFVDYAHTPDALEKVLSGLRRHCKGKLWVVFGCGGDRDTGKRPQMGSIAEHWADRVILTDDNPRGEASEDILSAILMGCRSDRVTVIQDRTMAIKTVINSADNRDCIVIAGKGHESYQEIRGVRMPFSDREVVLNALEGKSCL
ncbi:MAG: UDP-N-acetylmuramoyl-L-alanyl-D-glutamate--2,6-diaminopimelate ligase [Gammaproteobacteria bacterium]